MLVYMTPTFEKQVEELKRIGLENRKRYNAMSDEERLKLQEEYYREKHKPLTKAQRITAFRIKDFKDGKCNFKKEA